MRCASLTRASSPAGGVPPTVKVGVIIQSTVYDTSTAAGAAALAILEKWERNKSAEMPAPWRMTAGNSGSEFGSVRWFEALKAAYGVEGAVPRFKLWQLALADHVVSAAPVRCGVRAGH